MIISLIFCLVSAFLKHYEHQAPECREQYEEGAYKDRVIHCEGDKSAEEGDEEFDRAVAGRRAVGVRDLIAAEERPGEAVPKAAELRRRGPRV